ncbi:hypothetical protein HAX54_014093 [Datura stramonium]|uniref:Uncharacterized protein n=1 Tax=Datura stramonium TaxID=4076 RepID=A0ABS8TMJ9_DATST|nr:hypothetical protein [Datura stramonium]
MVVLDFCRWLLIGSGGFTRGERGRGKAAGSVVSPVLTVLLLFAGVNGGFRRGGRVWKVKSETVVVVSPAMGFGGGSDGWQERKREGKREGCRR